MHNLEEDSRSHILGRVAVKQPAHAIAKDIVVMHQIKLGKGVRIAARSLDQTNMFAFANGQIYLPLYSFSTCSNCHRDYKRTAGAKRCKKSRKVRKNRVFQGRWKNPTVRLEIAARFFESLAMTQKCSFVIAKEP
jgi:hypothetical protein